MLPWIVSSAAKGEYMEARTPAVRKLWGGGSKLSSRTICTKVRAN